LTKKRKKREEKKKGKRGRKKKGMPQEGRGGKKRTLYAYVIPLLFLPSNSSYCRASLSLSKKRQRRRGGGGKGVRGAFSARRG